MALNLAVQICCKLQNYFAEITFAKFPTTRSNGKCLDFPGKPVLFTDSARPFVLALAEWKEQNDGTGMGWHFQHARPPQIPWLIIIFAIEFAILDYPPLGKPIYHCCRCLHHSKPALPICNVYPNGQTAHIWATILKASRIPSCKQTLLVYQPTLSFLALRVDCTSITRNGSVQLCA